ncbi:histidine phosphatase family protein [Streptomyces sp. H10-C2]|uniref:SixA phosphatase family protein n=1 Tax=unclassified Streptomyces TaxID=2593676 RepID=UPI0024BBE424|nr:MULTISPECIES: histidine phosphatase family protein [unclassified Streptomyces]MDJ0346212.1 histidine phosphatase family protein [Streptomyces sp. PH10-H1]MDJ0371163.1 histidine phosphatase family protein [Streptomyces sp. H10-C2]
MNAPVPAPVPARLVVLRHAKSAWPQDVADHERPLAPRGLRDAPVAGQWLQRAGRVPDLVVCSPSRRTRETWDLVAPELDATPPVVFEPEVYDASAEALLDVVRKTPEECRTLLLIGHLPGLQDLVLSLTRDAHGDTLTRATTKFPTSAIAVLTLPGLWTSLAPNTTAFTHFTVPRGTKNGPQRGNR